MDFAKIFQFLTETYGYGGLVLSILIVVLFLMLPYFFKKSDKKMHDGLKEVTSTLTEAIKEENRELISGLKDNQSKLIDNQMELVKNVLISQKEEHDKNLSIRDSISTPIQNKINHLKDFYRCARVSVVEFHNSLVNMNGLPFKWYDLIYESVARGVHPISYEIRNMPFNIMLPIIRDVENGQTILFTSEDVENFYNKSSVLYDYCARHKVTSLIVSPIMNKEQQLVGIVALEYNPDHLMDDEVDAGELELEAHAISTLLEL